MRNSRLFSLPILILLAAPSVFACVCAGTTVEDSFKEATAIFTGKFLRSEYRKGVKDQFREMELESNGKGVEYEVLSYVFEADRWWKGRPKREVVLYTDHTRDPDGTEHISDCDVGFEVGREYLIYAYGEGDEFGTGACSLTKRISRAAKDIKALNRLARPNPTQ
jgi:hypothetical protein